MERKKEKDQLVPPGANNPKAENLRIEFSNCKEPILDASHSFPSTSGATQVYALPNSATNASERVRKPSDKPMSTSNVVHQQIARKHPEEIPLTVSRNIFSALEL